MKTLTISLLAAVFVFSSGPLLRSQAPAAPKSPLQQLQDIREKNKAQIEKQAATLLKLDALQQDATQIKFLGKRT